MKGSQEREELQNALKTVSENVEEVPIVIGNETFTTNDVRYQVMVILTVLIILTFLNVAFLVGLIS